MCRKGDSKGETEEKIQPMGDKLPEEFSKIDYPYGIPIHVLNLIFGGILTHICMPYYLFYMLPMGYIPWRSFFFEMFWGSLGGLGNNVGCHRYWTHRTFKANKKLQVLLMLMQTASIQHPIFKWCRDHRVHHKFMDTDADPYNAKRGFWFSHMNWYFQRQHPEVVKNFKTIDISDLVQDPIVRFQSKYYWELVLLISGIIPMSINHYLCPEMSWLHIFVSTVFRQGLSVHATSLVNSVGHLWGDKPYDKYISPTENKWVSIASFGEGWHNYHHTFPWDYKSAEFSYKYNLSALFINSMAMIGWAWDLKTVSHKLLLARIHRTGDGSHPLHRDTVGVGEAKEEEKPACWGWGDKELREEDVEITEIEFPAKGRI